jgi:hypothetical protein
MRRIASHSLLAVPLFAASLAPTHTLAQDSGRDAWPPLTERFESTGGGGYLIEGYHPVVIGGHCATAFVTIAPDGGRTRNLALFDAVAEAGGTLCTRGRWASADGTAGGTTPIEVFIRDGVRRRSP